MYTKIVMLSKKKEKSQVRLLNFRFSSAYTNNVVDPMIKSNFGTQLQLQSV